MTSKLFQLITGNQVTTETRGVNIDEEHIISSSKITLLKPIYPGSAITVFAVDAFGRDDKEIVKGAPATEGQYSITGQVITFNSTLTGKVKVYFATSKSVEVITSKPATALNYRIESDMIIKDIDTKEVKIAQLIIPNSQIQENFSITGSNEATEPAAIPLAIDCLEDGVTGKFYEILFFEDEKQA